MQIKNTSSWLMISSSPIMALSSPNWLMTWVALEIGSIGFIQMMKSKKSSESCILYFLVQVVASTIILVMMSSPSYDMKNILSITSMNSILISLSILMKMGAAPLHHWLIKTGYLLNNKELLILMTIQKSAPLLILQYSNQGSLTTTSAMSSALIGVFAQMSNSKMKTLILYSSLNHTGWMIIVSAINASITIFYLIVYSIMSWSILLIMKEMNMYSINNQESNKAKSTMIISLISMAGIPPLMGFAPKWIAISCVSKEENSFIMIIILMAASVANAFIYSRMFFNNASSSPSTTLFNIKSSKWKESIKLMHLVSTPVLMMSAK